MTTRGIRRILDEFNEPGDDPEWVEVTNELSTIEFEIHETDESGSQSVTLSRDEAETIAMDLLRAVFEIDLARAEEDED